MLTFNKKFGIHAFNAVAGATYEEVNWKGKSMNAKNFPTDDTEDNDMNAAIGDKEISSYRGKSQLMSYLFRVNYNLLDKYLTTFSIRRDGSSRLALNRWNNFYSGAIAWRLSDEPIIQSLGFFDNLKLRLSAGQTGNQGVNAYATRSKFVASNYTYDGALSSGMAEERWGGPAAPDLKWETTTQYDLGLDASFLDSRVNLVFDVYYKKTTDLLQYKLIPMSSGFSEIATNYGNVTNKGLELSGHFIPVKTRDFMWTLDANISFNKNEVSGLNADQFSDVVWGMESMFLRRNGFAIGTLYGYVEDGLYDNEAEVRANPYYANATASKVKSMVGQVKYKNLDDDPVIDNRDRTIIGNTNPDYQYGLTNNFMYKNWTFSFFLQGIEGNDILNANLLPFDLVGGNNMPQFVWDTRWTSDNRSIAKWPRPDNTYTRAMKASDRYVEDGSYLRCKNISLSYRWTSPVKYVESLNLTASVSNLFTISSYSWYDPDVNSFGSDASRRGVDLSSYPSARTINLGIQLSF
jgi:TonB-linked SusC/RagA family outer membrane protein